MDILIHTLSGLAIGTVSLPFIRGKGKSIGLLAIACFAGALPDIDAMSLWSGFDSTLGKWLDIEQSGANIYFSKEWYSHHAFMHSLMAAITLSIFVATLHYYRIRKKRAKFSWIYPLVFFFAYNAHLLGDLPTPGNYWGGINYFFPSRDYVGGFGYTWWWNNYDIFLLLCTSIMFNLIAYSSMKLFHFKSLKYLPSISFALMLLLSSYQLTHRDYDFNGSSDMTEFRNLEAKSKEIQRQILGDKLYIAMEWFDNSIPINF